MRALWSQFSRPRLGGSPSISSIESITSTLIRKTTTAPLRRRATFNDAFTILLAPVLAAALIVDTSWKAKQRKEWDEKLSVINEEIHQLHEREVRVWNSLRLTSPKNVHSGQRRGYATVAHAHAELDELEGEIEMPAWEGDNGQDEGGPSTRHRILPEALTPLDALGPVKLYHDGMFSAEEMANFHRYHRLNAIMLSIRMLLHLRVGPSPYFSVFPGENLEDETDVQFPQDTNQLVELLQLTRKELRPLHNRKNLVVVAPHIEAQASQANLNNTVKGLTTDFDEGRASIGQLIDGFGKALLHTTETLSVSSYVALIRSFSRIGKFSLAYHVVAALKNSTLPLSDEAVFHILFQIGQACDSRSLNHILPLITRSDAQFNVASKWERTRANGLELPVPASLNPRLLQVLVYAALRCEQPERAEGWLSLLREVDYGSLWKDHLFRSFLTYYTMHGNWEKGTVWLRRSIQHASSIAARSIDGVARVVFRMLDLCVRCRKHPEYTMILDAAINSGISPPRVDRNPNNRRKFYARARSILLEWESLPIPDSAKSLSAEEKARSFQEACKSLAEHVSNLSNESRERTSQDEDEDELVLMPPSTNNLRYAVRRQPKEDSADSTQAQSSDTTLGEVAKLQARFQRQDSTITSLKASLAIAEARYNASQTAEEEKLANAAKLQKTAGHLQTELRESRLALQRLHLQNQSYAREHAELREEIHNLKVMTKEIMSQQPIRQQHLEPSAKTTLQTRSLDTEQTTVLSSLDSFPELQHPTSRNEDQTLATTTGKFLHREFDTCKPAAVKTSSSVVLDLEDVSSPPKAEPYTRYISRLPSKRHEPQPAGTNTYRPYRKFRPVPTSIIEEPRSTTIAPNSELGV